MLDTVRPAKPVAPSVDALHETIRQLNETIEAQIKATNRQSKVMIWLAVVAVFLGVIQAGVALIPFWQRL